MHQLIEADGYIAFLYLHPSPCTTGTFGVLGLLFVPSAQCQCKVGGGRYLTSAVFVWCVLCSSTRADLVFGSCVGAQCFSARGVLQSDASIARTLPWTVYTSSESITTVAVISATPCISQRVASCCEWDDAGDVHADLFPCLSSSPPFTTSRVPMHLNHLPCARPSASDVLPRFLWTPAPSEPGLVNLRMGPKTSSVY